MPIKLKVSIGCKYNRLTVLEKVGRDKNFNSLWLCRCDCGKEKVFTGTSLTRLTRPTRSCGCYVSEINGVGDGEAAFNSLYRRYIKRDKDKNRESSLPKEIFRILTKSNCFYCGRAPSQSLSFKTTVGAYIYNGLDRLDNSKGYTIKNSLPCCKTCNYMKNDMNAYDFLEHIKKILTCTPFLPKIGSCGNFT